MHSRGAGSPRTLLVLALAAFALAGSAGCQSSPPKPAAAEKEATTQAAVSAPPKTQNVAPPPAKGSLPDFSLPLVAAGTEKTLTQKDLHGKPTLLYFWATWCAGCVMQSPAVAETAKHFQDQGVNILGINVDDTRRIAEEAAKQGAYPFRSVFDEKYQLRRSLNVTNFPSVFIFDAVGHRLYSAGRPVAAGKLKRVLAQGLKCGPSGCGENAP